MFFFSAIILLSSQGGKPMLYTVLGYREMDFKSQDGSQVRGTQIFVSYKDRDVVGLSAGKVFLRRSLIDEMREQGKIIVPGCLVDVEYNERGKVASVRDILSDKDI